MASCGTRACADAERGRQEGRYHSAMASSVVHAFPFPFTAVVCLLLATVLNMFTGELCSQHVSAWQKTQNRMAPPVEWHRQLVLGSLLG